MLRVDLSLSRVEGAARGKWGPPLDACPGRPERSRRAQERL